MLRVKEFTTVRLQTRSTGPGPVKYWVTHRCLATMTARCRSRKMSRSPGDVELPGGIITVFTKMLLSGPMPFSVGVRISS